MTTYDPLDAQQKKNLFWNHPLVTKDYVALTPSMPQVLEVVMDAIALHKKSLVFKAFPRMGKTTTCKFVLSALERHPAYKDRSISLVSADTLGEPNRRESIIISLAKFLGIPIPTRPMVASIRTKVLHEVESRLRNQSGRHWILIADELQALSVEDLEHLQYMQNELALHNIDTTLIGFSQTQISHKITLLKEQKRVELIVRFLNEVWDLPYCADQGWIYQTLKSYDADFTYPAGSNCSYTRFFLPHAYAAGFRIAAAAPDIYKVMSASAKALSLPLVPTEYIFEVSRLILIRSSERDATGFTLAREDIESIVIESKLDEYVDILKTIGAL
ncbi:ATP-binding protein [Pseudomonas sp. NPDC089422]|uniref:ATP-binding protein n=1 Tax=Pseudomonas sp. NPDC089422 TaxID=3364466 RepID=UPI00382853A3